MKIMIFILLASIPAHFALSQNIESGKSHELQGDEYVFPHNLFDKNFSLDTTWNKPEARLRIDIGHKRFKFGEKPIRPDRYMNYKQMLEAGINSFFPFAKMPFMKPYGLYRMNVIEVDPSLHRMPVK